MNDNNKLEIIRSGRSEEIDLLTPIEQGLINPAVTKAL